MAKSQMVLNVMLESLVYIVKVLGGHRTIYGTDTATLGPAVVSKAWASSPHCCPSVKGLGFRLNYLECSHIFISHEFEFISTDLQKALL